MKKIEIANKIVNFFKEYAHYNYTENMIGDDDDEIYRISSALFNIESIDEMIIQLVDFHQQAYTENRQSEYLKLGEIIDDLGNYRKNNKLDVLVLEPNKIPYSKTIINDLETIEREISGDVSIYLYKGNLNVYCDDNGYLKELEDNRYINNNLILGKFLIIASDRKGRRSLTEEEILKLSLELKEHITKDNFEIEDGGKKIC